MKDYYKTLGINLKASEDEIKKVYRKLAMQYHPDRNNGNIEAEKKFQEISEAYGVLGKEESRKKYDKKLNYGFTKEKIKAKESKTEQNYNESFNFENMEKNFEDFFGFNPKSNEKMIKNKKNPIDTSDLFAKFFNVP